MIQIKAKQRVNDLRRLLSDLQGDAPWKPNSYDDSRRWSYGDVENNGVFYHPQLTHYAHQAFEQFFYSACGIQYSDLSGREDRNQLARESHSPKIVHRMTFPVGCLHQWMGEPMYAGSLFHTWIDTVELSRFHLGVRAHIFNESEQYVALVIWVRWAKVLDPAVRIIAIPKWFPKRSRANVRTQEVRSVGRGSSKSAGGRKRA